MEGKYSGLDFLVDKLTNSIENTVTGDSFQTEVIVVTNRKRYLQAHHCEQRKYHTGFD